MEMISCYYEYYFLACQEIATVHETRSLTGVTPVPLVSLMSSVHAAFIAVLFEHPPLFASSTTYAFFFAPLRVTFPAHHIILVSITSRYLETRTTPENSHCVAFPFCYCFLSSILTSSLFLSTLRNVHFSFQIHII